ncbi:hypothetical protein GCM10027049_02920 [Mucilaginibacter puniceus]
MKFNTNFVLIATIATPVMYYSMDALWQGLVISLLFLCRVLYVKSIMDSTKILDQGATSYEYLKLFDRWLKNIFSRVEILARVTNTLIVPLAMSAVWSSWSKFGVIKMWTQKYPDLNIPLIAIIITVAFTLPMFYFSAKINKWDVRLMYGRLFDKLEETIADMEKLKQEE